MDDPRLGKTQVAVSEAGADVRARFIMRTYGHLLGAICAFVLMEVFLFQSGIAQRIALALVDKWLFVLGGYIVASWLASHVAHAAQSKVAQYAALIGFVAAWAIMFVPLLYVANFKAPGVIGSAALVTALAFTGLSGVVFMTRKDFSFLGGILRFAFVIALVLIVAGVIFGFQLGTFFSVAMVALAGAAVLYDTSNVLHHYPDDRYVGASLALFSSIALMFWYILRLFLSRD